jgi:hypothetical protein
MSGWSLRALVSLSIAAACARATDEGLLPSGDDSGGTSGSGASPSGGAPGTGGTTSTGGGANTGGATTTGGATATGGRGGTATGGTDAGGASDGGEGGTDVCSPDTRPPALRVTYKAGTKPATEDPDGEFRIVNDSDETVPLGELTLRYWFHSEFTCAETTRSMAVNVVHFQLDDPYGGGSTSSVTERVVALDSGAPGCDAYFTLGFASSAGSLAPNQRAHVIYYTQIPIYEASRPKDQSNDYSYGASTSTFVDFERTTLYNRGCLAYGREPHGGGGEGGAGGEGGGGMAGGESR